MSPRLCPLPSIYWGQTVTTSIYLGVPMDRLRTSLSSFECACSTLNRGVRPDVIGHRSTPSNESPVVVQVGGALSDPLLSLPYPPRSNVNVLVVTTQRRIATHTPFCGVCL